MPQSKVIARYLAAIATGQLRPDEAQRQVATRLGKAVTELEAAAHPPGLIARITRRKSEPVRGVYLWGGVGRGKSNCQIHRHNPDGDVIFIDGMVTKKFEENGKKYIEVEQKAITHRDELSAFGTSVAELPSMG